MQVQGSDSFGLINNTFVFVFLKYIFLKFIYLFIILN
jgi:hypothetical protein